jgi:hypothetical protein
MKQELSNLDYTIEDIKNKLSSDPDPFLYDVLSRLVVIRDNRQNVLVEKAVKKEKYASQSGYRGYGVS